MEPGGFGILNFIYTALGWTPPVRHFLVATLAIKWIVLLKSISLP
jgi:hypothetical protein